MNFVFIISPILERSPTLCLTDGCLHSLLYLCTYWINHSIRSVAVQSSSCHLAQISVFSSFLFIKHDFFPLRPLLSRCISQYQIFYGFFSKDLIRLHKLLLQTVHLVKIYLFRLLPCREIPSFQLTALWESPIWSKNTSLCVKLLSLQFFINIAKEIGTDVFLQQATSSKMIKYYFLFCQVLYYVQILLVYPLRVFYAQVIGNVTE